MSGLEFFPVQQHPREGWMGDNDSIATKAPSAANECSSPLRLFKRSRSFHGGTQLGLGTGKFRPSRQRQDSRLHGLESSSI